MPREILKFDQWRKALNEDVDPNLAANPTAAPAPGGATAPTPTPGVPLQDQAAGTTPTTDPATGLPTSAPTSSGLPDPLSASGQATPGLTDVKPEVPTYKMIFIDDEVNWETQNSDGGGTKKYTEYELQEPELDKWLEEKGWSSDKEEFTKMLTGNKHKVDSNKIDSLRKDIENEVIGDDMGLLDVDFDANHEVYISDLDVCFVSKNKES